MDEQVFRSAPWMRSDSASWATRLANLSHPRVARLNAYVDELRREMGEHVPWIDPFCGGEEAAVLFVLLRPGPKGAMETDFLSLANADRTARNIIEVMEAAQLPYAVTCGWNIVPWSGPREEKVTDAMLARGAGLLQRLLPLLPQLKAVVLVGSEAAKASRRIQWPLGISVLTCAHPGPIVWNQFRYRSHRQGIFDTYAEAARLALRAPKISAHVRVGAGVLGAEARPSEAMTLDPAMDQSTGSGTQAEPSLPPREGSDA